MRDNQVQNNFSAGEIDPDAIDRADSAIYKRGVARMENFILSPLGQATRRPGWIRLTNKSGLGLTGSAQRLFAYIFSSTQYYLLVIEAGRIVIVTVNGVVVQTLTGAPLTSITASNLHDIQINSRGDLIVLTHDDFWPIEIRRTSATTFTAANFTFYSEGTTAWGTPNYRYAPFYKSFGDRDYNGQSIGLTLSAATGAITVTASAAYFVPGHVGVIFGADGSRPGAGNYTHYATFTEGFVVTGYTSSTVVSATVIGTSSLGLAQDSRNWGELMWNSLRGYPRAACFHEQRLYFAGQSGLPNAIYGSSSAATGSTFTRGDKAYFDFDWMNTQDANTPAAVSPLLLFLSDDAVPDILRMHSFRNLHIFAANSEFIVPSSLTDSAITFANFRVRKQTPYGIRRRISPVVYDDATLFIERAAPIVREVVYNDLQKAYGAQSLSGLASHLQTGPLQMEVWKGSADRRQALLFVVQDDGTIAVMQGNRGNDTLGWHRWTTDGRFVAVAAIFEYLFALVERTVNGTTTLFLERLDETSVLDGYEAFSLGAPTDQLTGLTNFAGRTVQVTREIDGIEYPVAEVDVSAAGVADLPYRVQQGKVGFDPGVNLTLLPPHPIVRNAISVGSPKKIGRIQLGVADALNLQVDDQDKGPLRNWMSTETDVPAPIDHSSETERRQVRASSDKGARKRLATTITQRRASRLKILSVARDVSA